MNLLVFCLGIIVGAAAGVGITALAVANGLTPHVSDAEAGELATWFLKHPAVQRACQNYAARSPERDCYLPAMKAALDAYENVEHQAILSLEEDERDGGTNGQSK